MLLRAVRAAAVAVLVSWGTLVVLCVVGWLSTSATTTPMSSAVGVGSLAWTMANLGPVTDGTTTISLLPLGLVAWPLLVVARAVRPLADDLATDDSPRLDLVGGVRTITATSLGAFVGTYVALGLVVQVLGRLVPVHAVWWQALLGTVLVPVVGLVAGLRRPLGAADVAPRWHDQLKAAFPVAVRRGIVVGLRACGALLAAGLVPVAVSFATHLGQVADVQSGLHPGIVGGLLLVLGQLLLLPNAAAWGLSWLAGPGFTMGAGSSFTWTSSSSVLLPNIPVLGALPDSGSHSPLFALAVLVPVAVGAWTGWRALGTVSRLSAARAKIQVVAVAVASAAAFAMTALVLSGGALGTRALADIGPRALASSLALLVELAVGAAAVLGWSLWRFNRR